MDPGLTVLLVEDNPDDALLMQRAFKMNGLARPAHIAHDGAEAIAYLNGDPPFSDRRTYPYPDLVITDLKMPRASGFDLLAWLAERPDLRVIPTIVWGSSSDLRDVRHAYCLGANGYLCKPTDFQRFKDMVADIFRFWGHCLKPGPGVGPSCQELQATEPFGGRMKNS
jgi:CheY-like chemotaxis protein